MKRKISRMWQSGIAFLMALCLMIGLCPSVAFADETEKQTINYVSIGDSMANGYCFNGYAQGSGDVNHEYYDFAEGSYVYGDGAYPLQFEAWLEKQGYDVKHTKLAPSALLAEDLLYLLGGSEKPENDFFWMLLLQPM